MKLNKKIALILVIAFMMTIVAGCGGSKPAAEAPKEILVGANFELTGNVATFGQSTVNAIEMAFAEINAAGGVLGMPLKLIKADNKSDAGESTNVATKLVTQDKVIALLGPVTSTDVLAAVPVAMQYKVPLITGSGTNTKVTVDDSGKVNDFAFRTCFIDPFQGTVAGNFAADTLGSKTAAIYIDKNSDYSKGLAAEFKKAFEAKGGKIVAEEGFTTDDKDFRATLTKIKATKPDMMFVPAYYEQDGLIAKQARELGYTNPIAGGDGWDSAKLLEIAGAAALQNVYFVNHYSSADTDPKVVKFVGDYKAKYNETPDALAALGYDTAYMLVDAIKAAGSADPVKIKDALAAIKGFAGVTGTITMDANHNPVKAAAILTFDAAGNLIFKAKVNP